MNEKAELAEEPRIEAVFRNGSITAFGITVSFSLNFLAQWAASSGVWHGYDAFAAVAIFTGVALQIRSVALLLPVEGLRKSVYDRATRFFLWGLSLTGLGVFAAVTFDLLAVVLFAK